MSTALVNRPPAPQQSTSRSFVPAWQAAGVLLSVAILAVAVWLRLWKLGNLPGVNGDEAWSGVQALRFLAGESVAWRTPTGNPLNIFHFGPLVMLHAWLPPSFELLRSVAAASGLAALAANYWLCRKSYDRPTAVASTLLLAALPINVAYSRFAWDASQTLLATVLAIQASLIVVRQPIVRRAATIWAIVAFAAGLWIHPTNVFVAPLLGVCLTYAWRTQLQRRWAKLNAGSGQKTVLAAAFVLGMALAWLLAPWLRVAAARLVSPLDWAHFVRDLRALFSGTSVYRYVSGSYAAESLDLSDALAAGLIALAAVGFYRRWIVHRDACDACLFVGWALCVLAFFLVAGPAAIAPHFERYAICLIAPTTLLLTRGALWWMSQPARIGLVARAAFAAVCVLLMASFYANYFQFIAKTGGDSHRTFRTAAVEPKLQAWQYIVEHSEPGQPIQIVTDEWWSYWPLAYLAGDRSDVQVVMHADDSTGKMPVARTRRLATSGVHWRVEFATPDRTPESAPLTLTNETNLPAHVINDYAGRPVLRLFGPTEKISQNY